MIFIIIKCRKRGYMKAFSFTDEMTRFLNYAHFKIIHIIECHLNNEIWTNNLYYGIINTLIDNNVHFDIIDTKYMKK